MASFMSNFFPGGKQDKSGLVSRPETPTKNNFITPISTPQGSPSKKTLPPGANDLPVTFDTLNLGSTMLDSPLKLGQPQSAVTPLAPVKGNTQVFDDSTAVDDSIIHKGGAQPVSQLKKQQGQENTPPPSIPRLAVPEPALTQHNHAALSRQDLYTRDRPITPAKKFNTSRGLTPEELEILQRPNVKRLVNVTQLCEPADLVRMDRLY